MAVTSLSGALVRAGAGCCEWETGGRMLRLVPTTNRILPVLRRYSGPPQHDGASAEALLKDTNLSPPSLYRAILRHAKALNKELERAAPHWTLDAEVELFLQAYPTHMGASHRIRVAPGYTSDSLPSFSAPPASPTTQTPLGVLRSNSDPDGKEGPGNDPNELADEIWAAVQTIQDKLENPTQHDQHDQHDQDDQHDQHDQHQHHEQSRSRFDTDGQRQ